MLDLGSSYGIIAVELTALTDATSLCPGSCGVAGEGGTHGGHEAAHG
jgi:hypothetical protein